MNHQSDNNEQVSVWKGSFQGGLIMGIAGSLYLMIFYFTDQLFSSMRGIIWIPILLIMLFYVMKQFRDNYRGGLATFGEAFSFGAVASIYYGVIMAIMVFILYGLIDPELPAKQLAFTESTLIERGMQQQEIDIAMKLNEKINTPAVLSLIQLITGIAGAMIATLIIALFVRKEGNPMLAD